MTIISYSRYPRSTANFESEGNILSISLNQSDQGTTLIIKLSIAPEGEQDWYVFDKDMRTELMPLLMFALREKKQVKLSGTYSTNEVVKWVGATNTVEGTEQNPPIVNSMVVSGY